MLLKVLKDYTGRRIGKVTILYLCRKDKVHLVRTGEEVRPSKRWHARCDCGHEWDIPHSHISANSPQSCNLCADRTPKAKLKRSREHLKKAHPSYGSWYAMVRRCTSKLHQNYHNYGGRGITVTPEWMDFDNFVRDMGIRPQGHTIDRIDNDKGYAPNNCRWATPKQQRANIRPKQNRKLRP